MTTVGTAIVPYSLDRFKGFRQTSDRTIGAPPGGMRADELLGVSPLSAM